MRQPAPLLICCDLQQEYIATGRAHTVRDGDAALGACGRLLSAWRDGMWPIVHLKRVARAAWFNPASSLTDWIPGWRPQPGELIFEHPLPSAYSSPRFADYLANLGPLDCFVMGFSLEETILSTAIEGFHRGQRLICISDAVAGSRPREDADPDAYLTTLIGLVARFAEIQTEEQALAAVG
ncbi:cysteine hydrolase [Phreatobacter stygius]|uniref:Cysteine hydrolase n=1 Tax=Phreatobacter stygius TaxID=1940610 RepID=A0A4D7BEZ0_9HYPH|nr:cysteine hydrolase [Phreatobacter stygius]